MQIIAHEPSRCEGCFDGRLPLLLIVVFIALVLFLLCVGVILDAEGDFLFCPDFYLINDAVNWVSSKGQGNNFPN